MNTQSLGLSLTHADGLKSANILRGGEPTDQPPRTFYNGCCRVRPHRLVDRTLNAALFCGPLRPPCKVGGPASYAPCGGEETEAGRTMEAPSKGVTPAPRPRTWPTVPSPRRQDSGGWAGGMQVCQETQRTEGGTGRASQSSPSRRVPFRHLPRLCSSRWGC